MRLINIRLYELTGNDMYLWISGHFKELKKIDDEISLYEKKYPNGFYYFNKDELKINYDNLFNAFSSKFEKFSIAYSFKTNYTPLLCKILKSKGIINYGQMFSIK